MSKVNVPPVMEAVLNGFDYKGYVMNPAERQIVMFLESVGSKAWTVSGLSSLPLEWLAIRLGMPPRTLDRNLKSLIDAGIITVEDRTVYVRNSKTTRPGATYRLSSEFRDHARAFTLTTVKATKSRGNSKQIFAAMDSNHTGPMPPLQALYDRWIARLRGRA